MNIEEREELKRILKEAIKEFINEHYKELIKEWESKGYPFPLPYVIVKVRESSEKDFEKFRRDLYRFHETTDRFAMLVYRLESWAPQCSEKERIRAIEDKVNEIDKKIDKLLDFLSSK